MFPEDAELVGSHQEFDVKCKSPYEPVKQCADQWSFLDAIPEAAEAIARQLTVTGYGRLGIKPSDDDFAVDSSCLPQLHVGCLGIGKSLQQFFGSWILQCFFADGVFKWLLRLQRHSQQQQWTTAIVHHPPKLAVTTMQSQQAIFRGVIDQCPHDCLAEC